MSIVAIILGAGIGERFGSRKQYVHINGEAIIARAINVFTEHHMIDTVIPVIHAMDTTIFENLTLSHAKLAPYVIGGITRHISGGNGLLKAADYSPDLVLIHDAVRPFVNSIIIDNVLNALFAGYKAVVPVVNIHDSVKISTGHSLHSIDRNQLFIAQTPQGFDYRTLMRLRSSLGDETNPLDDADVFCFNHMPVHGVRGNRANFKITEPEDVFMMN